MVNAEYRQAQRRAQRPLAAFFVGFLLAFALMLACQLRPAMQHLDRVLAGEGRAR